MEVYLKLENELLTDYCKYLFPNNNLEGPHIVKGSHQIGALLIAHCRVSERPVPVPDGDHVLKIELPVNNTSQSLNNKFLYYTQGDHLQLNAAIKAWFDIDFYTYYNKAEGIGLSKKQIIEAFITSRKLFSTDPSDALSKRVYRRETSKREAATKLLVRRVYYLNEALDTTGIVNP